MNEERHERTAEHAKADWSDGKHGPWDIKPSPEPSKTAEQMTALDRMRAAFAAKRRRGG